MTAELKPFRAGDGDVEEWVERLSRVFEDNPYLEQLLSGKLVPKSQKQTMLGDSVSIGGTLSVDGAVSLDGPVVINEDGTATGDLRVEGDTQDKLIYARASTDAVGIRGTPEATFHVVTTGQSAFVVGAAWSSGLHLSENQIWAAGTLNINNETHTGTSQHDVNIATGTAGGEVNICGGQASSKLTVYAPTIINEGGSDYDFRVESDTLTHALFVDAGAGAVGINQASPDAVAILDIVSTTKGVLIPRMTTTQRDAISTPPEGLLLYNTTTHKLTYRNDSTWVEV